MEDDLVHLENLQWFRQDGVQRRKTGGCPAIYILNEWSAESMIVSIFSIRAVNYVTVRYHLSSSNRGAIIGHGNLPLFCSIRDVSLFHEGIYVSYSIVKPLVLYYW